MTQRPVFVASSPAQPSVIVAPASILQQVLVGAAAAAVAWALIEFLIKPAFGHER